MAAPADNDNDERTAWDYVIVGSGAGGGTLAARLVEAGRSVFLLEAGSDARDSAPVETADDYDVPAFHPFACENPAMSWNFHVRHYADEQQQARDPKYQPGLGVLYPRAATLGGCTAHNAMIFLLPHDDDWNDIARRTGDYSWHASQMQRYAKRVEACHHQPLWRALRRLGIDPTRHGWDGWLSTEKSIPLDALGDRALRGIVRSSARTYVRGLPTPWLSALRWLRGKGDPNAAPWGRGAFEGLCYTPLATRRHQRAGIRERLLGVARQHPGRLRIELDALATRVLFDAGGAARGVEYLKGARLYRAHASPSTAAGERREVRARHEVILCGGSFNTPQLLMLSGIGPAAELHRHRIALRKDLPGVGRNLQDRYEVAVTHRTGRPWQVLAGARYQRDDPLWTRWHASQASLFSRWRAGLYGSNGAALGLIRRSDRAGVEPDLFSMALLANFEGYRPGFSEDVRAHADRLTWAVLKAHTRNRAGRITLRSADPREMPQVDFHSFDLGDDPAGDDLRAVVQAIRQVRELTAPLLRSGLLAEELSPGPAVQSDEALANYVRDTAWGHHASCSCPIGSEAEGGVLDAGFAVHGTRRLRVVDASAFPRIPGFFIASAIYMIAEKAADVLLQSRASTATH